MTKPKGFDLGLRRVAIGVIGPEFANNLHDAGVDACAYGVAHIPSLGGNLPTISLVGRIAEPLRAAFDHFHRYAERFGGDAISIDFLLLKSGGYVMGLGPSKRVLRALLKTRFLDPLYMGVTWTKRFDTLNPQLLRIRSYLESQALAPFVFSACIFGESGATDTQQAEVLHGGSIAQDALDAFVESESGLFLPRQHAEKAAGSAIEPIDGLQELIKFEARFVEEEHANEKPWSSMLLRIAQEDSNNTPENRELPPPPEDTPEDIVKRREKVLELYYGHL